MPIPTSEDGADPVLSLLREATLPAYYSEEERKHLSEKIHLEHQQFEREKAERERLEHLRAEEAKAEVERTEREKARKAREENEKLMREEAEQAKILRTRREITERAKREGANGVDPLLPVLREGPVPPAPIVDPKQIARLERAERVRAKREQARREKAELARAQEEQAQRERIARELEKLERERQEEAELAKSEFEAAELERAKAEKAERERAQATRAEMEKAERAQAQATKAELEKIELERARRVQAEQEEAERDRVQAERERIAQEAEQAERDRQEAADLARAESERTKLERAEREKTGRDQTALEKAQTALAKAQVEVANAQADAAEAQAKAAEARAEQTARENADFDWAKDKTTERKESEPAKPETSEAESAGFELQADAASEGALLGNLSAAAEPRRLQAVGLALLVLLAVAGALYASRESLFRPTPLGPDERLMVTAIENRTGDARLDGAAAEAMEFELQESPNLDTMGSDAYRSAARQVLGGADHAATPELARQAAEKARAKAYLYGSLRSAGSGYILSVDVLNVEDNRKLMEVDEVAPDRDQIAAAIDRAAERLRLTLVSDHGLHVGTGGEASWRSDVPLVHEATANLDALHQYSVGEAAELDGRTNDALAAFQSAAMLDPKFIQAQMRLAWLYREQHAEKESAQAAQFAEQAAVSSSEHTRLLAQATYEANATGSLEQAEETIRRFIAVYPHDAQGALELARVLRLEGR